MRSQSSAALCRVSYNLAAKCHAHLNILTAAAFSSTSITFAASHCKNLFDTGAYASWHAVGLAVLFTMRHLYSKRYHQ